MTNTANATAQGAGYVGEMLAEEPDEKHPINWACEMHAEPKMDGYRLSAVIDDSTVRFHCRSAEEITWAPNLAHIAAELLRLGFRNCMVDGEVMADDWNSTGVVRSGASGKKYTTPKADVRKKIVDTIKFHAFDYVELELGSLASVLFPRARKPVLVWQVPYRERKAILASYFTNSPSNVVRYVAGKPVTKDTLETLMNDELSKPGGEGLILKDVDGLYVFDRSYQWLKIKAWKTFELQIVDVVEGKGKQSGMMGALKCVDKAGTEISVGTGFEDELRIWYWAHRDLVVGDIIEVRAQVGDVATSRHTSFQRKRPDRTAL